MYVFFIERFIKFIINLYLFRNFVKGLKKMEVVCFGII